MGILQRVALCYFVAAAAEIVLPEIALAPLPPPLAGSSSFFGPPVISMHGDGEHGDSGGAAAAALNRHVGFRGHWRLVQRRGWHWALMAALVGFWCLLTYGVDTGCGRGRTDPDCNVASWLDEQVLGVAHMYFPHNGGDCEGKEITFQRTEACSSCAPGKCFKEGAPAWCGYESVCGGAPFDPEGLLSSVTCVVAALWGAHAGRVALAFEDPLEVMGHWLWMGALGVALGLFLHLPGWVPLNTDLYSPSFLLLTNGASVLVLAACYQISDVARSKALEPFRWLGMNSIAIYLLACSGVPQSVLGCLYWGEKEANLSNVLWPTGVYWGPRFSDSWLPPANERESTQGQGAVMLWCVLGYIPFWILVAGCMHRRGWYFKV